MTSPTNKPVNILHAHSTMSMLDGASPVEDYVDYAVSNGLKICACTDHGWLSGVYDLVTKCGKAGITPIAGCEFYLQPHPGHKFADNPYDYFHLTVWASNMVGYKNLVALGTRSWSAGRPISRWGKHKPRITWDDLQLHHEGLWVGTGCIEGPIGKCVLKGEIEQARINADILHAIFGDRLFFEMMPATVDRDYVKKESIQVTGENGIVYCFMPKDILETSKGSMTALEALKKKPDEIFSMTPIRMQDGPFVESDSVIIPSNDSIIMFDQNEHIQIQLENDS